MKLVIPKGATSRIITVFVQDSSSTTGAGLGSLDENSSIVGGYVREGGTGVALAVDENVTTEGTYQAPSAAGKVRIGTPANMPTGFYELHFHNDLFAAGAETLTIGLGGASDMAPLNIEIQLSDPVRGLGSPTALPNSAADAAGGLVISDAGGLDIDTKLANTNEVTAARMAALTDWIDGGRLDLILDARASQTSITTVQNDLDILTGVDGATLATSQPNYAPATAAALATHDGKLDTVDGIVDDILLDTAEIGTAGAGLTNINLPNQTMDITGNITGNLSGSVGSVTGSVGSVTGNVGGNVTGSIGSLATQAKADVNSEVDATIETYGLDHLLQASVTGTDVADNSILAKLVSKSATADWDDFDNTAYSLQALRDRGDAAWITATGFSTLDSAGIRTAVGLASADLDTQLGDIDTDIQSLLGRITSTLFSGITSLAEWLGLLAGKQTPDATALTEIRATGAGSGTYDATADSQEAIKDNTAWNTATGFSTFDASTDAVTTDAASRTASKADVSALAIETTADAAKTAAESADTEVKKVPRLGETYKHRNVDTDVEADVIIEATS